MINKDDFTQIGYIIRSHGLFGECTARLSVGLDDVYENPDKNLFLFLDIDDCLIPFKLIEYRYKSIENVFLSFVDVNTKEDADNISGKAIWIENHLLENNFIDINNVSDISMLTGFYVVNSNDDTLLGYIESIDTSTINTLANIVKEDNSNLLIPLAIELISGIDVNSKYVYFNLPEGLI